MTHAQRPDEEIIFSVELFGVMLHFQSTWGLFSPRALDEGSGLLLRNVDSLEDAEHILDIGCGYGALGVTLGKRFSHATVDMVDKDFVAVEYAQRNIKGNHVKHAKAYLSNGLSHVPHDYTFDLVVSNIPAKVGREMLLTMFLDAHEHMTVGGRFYVVCINGLKDFVKNNFKTVFGNVHKEKGSAKYCCYYAQR